MKEIKFVSYDGKYPNLCSGTLILEIDGEKYILDHYHNGLISGGSAGVNFSGDESQEYCTSGPWQINYEELEEQCHLKFNLAERHELKTIINRNIEWGCCGGCI